MNLHIIDIEQQNTNEKHDILINSPKCYMGTKNLNLARRMIKNYMKRLTFLHIYLGIACFTLNHSCNILVLVLENLDLKGTRGIFMLNKTQINLCIKIILL